MRTLLWAEYKKLRRSSIVWITVFATVMIAVIVFVEGQGIHDGPDVQYGLKIVHEGSQYIDNVGWYMDEAQPLATFFVLPAVIALLGSYMICREEEDDTLKSLRLIPVNEVKLTTAKMIMAFMFSVFIYLLLFSITLLTEAVLHFSDLSAALVLKCLKEYFRRRHRGVSGSFPDYCICSANEKGILDCIGVYRNIFLRWLVCRYVK